MLEFDILYSILDNNDNNATTTNRILIQYNGYNTTTIHNAVRECDRNCLSF